MPRRTTYVATVNGPPRVPGSQVKAADLNDMQDEIYGVHKAMQTIGVDPDASGSLLSSVSNVWIAGGAGDHYYVPLTHLMMGDRVTKLTVRLKNMGDGDKVLKLAKRTAPALPGSNGFASAGATWELIHDHGITAEYFDLEVEGDPYTVAEGEQMFLHFEASAISDQFVHVIYEWDRPSANP